MKTTIYHSDLYVRGGRPLSVRVLEVSDGYQTEVWFTITSGGEEIYNDQVDRELTEKDLEVMVRPLISDKGDFASNLRYQADAYEKLVYELHDTNFDMGGLFDGSREE